MNKYELMFIIASKVSEEKREELINKFKSYVEAHKGTVDGVEKIGMKKFAYPIQDKNEGYYVLMNFQADATTIAKLEEQMSFTEFFVRKMIIKK